MNINGKQLYEEPEIKIVVFAPDKAVITTSGYFFDPDGGYGDEIDW